ncbi:hypothetical protein QJQ45_013750 [Haematococcus lacustris]|nr:hypothetical protein QJQ45_013750 [Haematococcus lacustris]
MLLGDSPDPRYITVDTGVTESGQCAPSDSRWDTELVVFAHTPYICGADSTVLSEAWDAEDDDNSTCGPPSSRVAFTAAPGQDYLIVVKGYIWEATGPATIVINSTLSPTPDAGVGTCSNPYVIAGLPVNATNHLFGVGFNTQNSTVNYDWDSLNLHVTTDFTFMLLGDSPDPRYITVDTGVTESGQCAPFDSRWDTELVVFAHTPYICGADSTVLSEAWDAEDDDNSTCGPPSSRVAFTAAPGQDYLIVVKGYIWEATGPATIVINSTLAVIPPTPDAGVGTCSNPYVIAGLPVNATNQLFGVGFDTYNSFANYNWDSMYVRDSADFTFMLAGDSPDPRYITVDTGVTESGQCAPSDSRWDTELVVFWQSPNVCGVNSIVLSEQAWVTINDDNSVCGHPSSRVTFIATPGQDYLIVVKGYDMASAGPATIVINSTLAVIPPTPDAGKGSCSNPYVIAGLPVNATNQLFGVGFDTYNSTVNYNWDSMFLRDSADFTFMLAGDSPDPRYITVDTGVTESGQCAPSDSRWDTELVVFRQSPYICRASPAMLFEAWVASNDEASVCRRPSSRVAFIAAPGQDYLIVVKGYNMTFAGPATIVINSTLAVIPPTPELGQCQNPVAIAGVLPGQSPSIWGAGASTCDVLTTSWFYSQNPDFTLRLLGDVDMEREVELDTCVEGQAAWDTEITVYSDEPDICGDPDLQDQASAHLAFLMHAYLTYDDNGSSCGGRRSRLSFTAAPGASYLIVVSGYGNRYRCGSAALAVTAFLPVTPEESSEESSSEESSREESSEASAVAAVRSRKLLTGA